MTRMLKPVGDRTLNILQFQFKTVKTYDFFVRGLFKIYYPTFYFKCLLVIQFAWTGTLTKQ